MCVESQLTSSARPELLSNRKAGKKDSKMNVDNEVSQQPQSVDDQEMSEDMTGKVTTTMHEGQH